VETVRQFDDNVPKDAVIASEPSFPATAPRDTVVKLIVSDGPAPVTIPDVSGKSYDDAAQMLSSRGFSVNRKDAFSSTVDKDKVVGTEPASGQLVPKGSAVTIVVSKGPELVTVPKLTGLTLEAALAQLQQLGLVADTTGYLPGRLVRLQDPAANSMVAKG